MFKKLNDLLAGYPDETIKVLLIVLSTMGYLIAFLGTPSMRLFFTAWYLLP